MTIMGCAPASQVSRQKTSSESVVPDVLSMAKAHYQAGRRAMTNQNWELAQLELERALALLWRSDFQPVPRAIEERRVLRLEVEQAMDELAALTAAPGTDEAADSLYAEEREVPAAFSQLMKLSSPKTDLDEMDLRLPDFSRFDLPVVMNRQVGEAIHLLRTSGASEFASWMNRVNRYNPIIRSIFQKEKLPYDLTSVALIESGFHPRAYSEEDGTAGLWQFTLQTGTDRGLNRTAWVDERFDPEKSTWAAAGHFKYLYGLFGDWALVLAAHHVGVESVQDLIEKTGVVDFWRMDLPEETVRFVSLVMAATIIAKTPDVYGFRIQALPPLTYETVMVDRGLSLETIAEGMEIALDPLKMLNPELRDWRTPAVGYALKIPTGSQPNFMAWTGVTPPEPAPTDMTAYTVRRGDTILEISRRFNISPKTIIAENDLRRPNRLLVGQVLFIPLYDGGTNTGAAATTARVPPPSPSVVRNPDPASRTKTSYRVKPGDTLDAIGRRYGVTSREIQVWNNIGSPRDLQAGQTLTIWAPPGQSARTAETQSSGSKTAFYTVRRGDTLWEIARKFNVTVSSVRAANDLNRRAAIYPGNKLVIPLP